MSARMSDKDVARRVGWLARAGQAMYAGDELLTDNDAPDVGEWDCDDCTPFLCSCDTDGDAL